MSDDGGRTRADAHDRAGPNQAYGLAEIRRNHSRVRQSDVATLMGVSQARVSKLERGDLTRTELGSVQAYITALGGSSRVLAEFGERRIELRTSEPESPHCPPERASAASPTRRAHVR